MPPTAESRMAKMKKKISSPLVRRRNLSGGKLSILSLITVDEENKSCGITCIIFDIWMVSFGNSLR